jgi:alkylation response protein AidB-like acyl-CoA dehydrogenase
MLTTIALLIFFGLIWTLAFLKVSRLFWVPIVALSLFLLGLVPSISHVLLTILWVAYLALALLFTIQPLRLKLLSKPVFNLFRKLLPPISDTEKIALEAGTVGWEGELFAGRPQWQKFLQLPAPHLTEEEQHFLANQTEQLCEMLNDWEIVHDKHDLPKKVWQYLKKAGFFGLAIPKEYGGQGFSALAQSTIVMKIASRSLSAAVNVMVPNSLGPAELLLHYGTEEQKKYYLPALASGKEIPCFALTATEAGSDASSIKDSGIVCKGQFEGKEVIGIRLNWDKRYITLAPVGTVLGLAFQMEDPEGLLGGEKQIGITLCLIPTDHPGVEVGPRHLPLNLAFMNGPTRGKDVFIPLDWIIGGPAMCGKGWQMLMESLSAGRGISLPALATAIVKLCYRVTGAYALLRKQFNVSIGQFEGIEEGLARIAGLTYTCEAARVFTAAAININQGKKPAVATAIVKYHLTEMGRIVANAAMDIHGGRAIQMGPRNYLGQVYQGLPVSITVEGANILTRNLIIFGQGAMRCHPYIRSEVEAATQADQVAGLKRFDRLLLSHMGYTLSNFVRVLSYGLTGGIFIRAPKGCGHVAHYYRQITRMSAALALVSDITMLVLGGQLKRKERISARLGDVLSELYLGSTVLKYFHDQSSPGSDLNLVHWSLKHCLFKTQNAFSGFFANFPSYWWAFLMKNILFPWGNTYSKPSDQLEHMIAQAMLRPSALLERLTQGIYISKDSEDTTGRIENAWQAMVESENAYYKLNKAIQRGAITKVADFAEQIMMAQTAGILTAEEVVLLRKFKELQLDALKVDEFK